eukprot:scaffold421282_cov56-Attheya_sp.AAC.3
MIVALNEQAAAAEPEPRTGPAKRSHFESCSPRCGYLFDYGTICTLKRYCRLRAGHNKQFSSSPDFGHLHRTSDRWLHDVVFSSVSAVVSCRNHYTDRHPEN